MEYKEDTFGGKVLQFNDYLASVNVELPDGFLLNNPFNGINKKSRISPTFKLRIS